MNDKEIDQNKKYFNKYIHKVRIHFIGFSIMMLILVSLFFILYSVFMKRIMSLLIKLLGTPFIQLKGTFMTLIAVVAIAFILLIWISKFNAMLPKIKYGKYKLQHPHLNREDLKLLIKVGIWKG